MILLKRIFIIIILIIIYVFIIKIKTKDVFLSKVDLNLRENEVAIVLYNDDMSTYFYIVDNGINNLFLFEPLKDKKVNEFLSAFHISKLDNLFSYSESKLNSINKFSLYDKNKINNIEYYNFKIKIFDYTFCTYQENINNNIDDCTFIYFNAIDKSINLSNSNKVVIYKDSMPDNFKEMLYTKWIDIYELSSENYTVIKIVEDNYNIINIPT